MPQPTRTKPGYFSHHPPEKMASTTACTPARSGIAACTCTNGGLAVLKFSKRNDWTEEQDKYLADHHAYQTIEEMGHALGISRGRVKYRLDKLGIEKKRLNAVPEDQKTPAPDKAATHWVGGRYWRLPPKQTWHKGITGRLIHKSTTARDLEAYK